MSLSLSFRRRFPGSCSFHAPPPRACQVAFDTELDLGPFLAAAAAAAAEAAAASNGLAAGASTASPRDQALDLASSPGPSAAASANGAGPRRHPPASVGEGRTAGLSPGFAGGGGGGDSDSPFVSALAGAVCGVPGAAAEAVEADEPEAGPPAGAAAAEAGSSGLDASGPGPEPGGPAPGAADAVAVAGASRPAGSSDGGGVRVEAGLGRLRPPPPQHRSALAAAVAAVAQQGSPQRSALAAAVAQQAQHASQPCSYDLLGVVEHSGAMRYGHYVAYVKRSNPAGSAGGAGASQWYYCSDSTVRPVTEAQVLRAQAYILLYGRRREQAHTPR
ncbi:Ubiquitin carboxyl-terminal hydrolase 16 [Tetrabaena socialis]|uniref:Ubiquitin carboxyl-terminal hydrolase 16 n=1 Tax=Tetrabaena socialis TaxID=47790 RepID=A0A2J8A9R9_9CHLO|nr:Ubiquitin carboxyl-terminal hydrolase 16 [Tetrabaena socialis]|eukprot:PNH09259.1 Ubiquitin carboxyl-terminal hydrolase 16 [Tetrabaena socialis]